MNPEEEKLLRACDNCDVRFAPPEAARLHRERKLVRVHSMDAQGNLKTVYMRLR